MCQVEAMPVKSQDSAMQLGVVRRRQPGGNIAMWAMCRRSNHEGRGKGISRELTILCGDLAKLVELYGNLPSHLDVLKMPELNCDREC